MTDLITDVASALQAAIYERLTSQISVPVFDSVPQGTTYPYVTIDSLKSNDSSPIKGQKRDLRMLYLSVWSDYPGQAEVHRINAEVAGALHETPMPLKVGRVVSIRIIRTESDRDADGVTYQGSVTAQVITQG